MKYQAFQDLLDNETIHSLIERRAREDPTRIALADQARTLDYRELDEASRSVAQRLIAAGVTPGDWVGVCLDRGVNLVVGVLGVLRAGAAYVPLDPDFPRQRLGFMVEDAGIRTLMTESALLGEVVGPERTVVVDEPAAEIESAELPTVRPDAIAYVIYTSGSTGRPKGVKQTHRSVVNLLSSMAVEPGISRDDRWLAVTTLSFDISVLELFGPLLQGATTCVASREEVMEGTGIRSALERTGANVMQATPVMWRMVLEAGWEGRSDFRALCGGEALPQDLATDLLAKVGSLWNMYGPTETTIWSTCHRVEPSAPILIGRPVANTFVYVLDKAGRPLPPGVPGEIYIGGAGVAVGYHNREELDAERFLPDPFAGGAARMYRTGDLGRYLRDGRIEYKSRADNQVKIRGFRVELGEIEAALAELAGVRQAAVVVRRGGRGDDRLVAFLVPDGQAPSAEQIRESLARELPRYMIPHHFLEIDELPVTPNGKIDRRALLERITKLPDSSREYTPPRTPAEEAVAKVMAEVLEVERVGADADFFDLGGHSVLAMRVVARLRESLAPSLTLRDMFQSPTVAALGARIDALRQAARAPVDDADFEEVVF